jgi:hypothetical protein
MSSIGTCHFCGETGGKPGHNCQRCGTRHKIYLVIDIYEGDEIADWKIEEYDEIAHVNVDYNPELHRIEDIYGNKLKQEELI